MGEIKKIKCEGNTLKKSHLKNKCKSSTLKKA